MYKHSPVSAITSFSYLLVGFLSLVLAFPLFLFLHKQFPDYDWVFHADRVLMFLFAVIFSLLVLRLFRPVIVVAFIITLGWLGFGSISGKYGFETLFSDYQAMLYAIKYEPGWEKMAGRQEQFFPYKKQIIKAADHHHEAVRFFAVNAATRYFKKEQKRYATNRKLIQYFSVFKQINSQWDYVDDPDEGEYLASAAESVKLMAGDCDDYAILMVASIKAIGGTARLVRTTGHLYPEMKLSSRHELEMANYLVKKILFQKESRGNELNYHMDDDGGIWLNLDYTADYPGGKFLEPDILGVLIP